MCSSLKGCAVEESVFAVLVVWLWGGRCGGRRGFRRCWWVGVVERKGEEGASGGRIVGEEGSLMRQSLMRKDRG